MRRSYQTIHPVLSSVQVLFFHSVHDLFDNLDLSAIVNLPPAQRTRGLPGLPTYKADEMASYRSFKELSDHEVEGQDYRIRIELRDPCVLIMAPHGGKIEPMTAEISEAIAGMDHSFYCLEGLKADGNSILHIESHLFDEPRALQAVEKADVVITVHGQLDQKKEFVMTGGLHTRLCLEVERQLESNGFQTRPPEEGLMGADPRNICNRGKSKQGVQLEVSRKVRDSLRNDRDRLRLFAEAVRRAIRTRGW